MLEQAGSACGPMNWDSKVAEWGAAEKEEERVAKDDEVDLVDQ
jgi:hypothetical protein